MVISFLDPFCRKVLPRNWKHKQAKGSWLAVGPKEEDRVIATKKKPSAKDKWNRRGLVKTSAQYAWERTGQPPDKYKMTNAAASRFSPSPSGMSDWTTAACTRETPSPGFRSTTPGVRPETPDEHHGHHMEAGDDPYRQLYPEEKLDMSLTKTINEDADIKAARENLAFEMAFEKQMKEKEMKWLLLPRGRDMNEEEYNRLVLDTMKPRTRSTSRYESCLLPDRVRQHPAQVAHHAVNERLVQDKQTFNTKYDFHLMEEAEEAMEKKISLVPAGKTEMKKVVSDAWKMPTSSYSIQQVRGAQHNKFTRIQQQDDNAAAARKRAEEAAKFDIRTLRNWFMSIDVENKGSLSRRQMLKALWQNDHLCDIFGKAVGVETKKSAKYGSKTLQEQARSLNDPGDASLDVDEDTYANDKAEELRSIARILRDIDDDRSGTLTWDELVEFFRRTGHLLTYETEQGHNDMTAFWIESAYRKTIADRTSIELPEDSPSPSHSTSSFRLFAIRESIVAGDKKATKESDALRRAQQWQHKPQAQNSQRRSVTASVASASAFERMDSGGSPRGIVTITEEESNDPDLQVDLAPAPGMLELPHENNDRPLSAGSSVGRGHGDYWF
jgi:hypothetical protein